jgi:hypothetical protein
MKLVVGLFCSTGVHWPGRRDEFAGRYSKACCAPFTHAAIGHQHPAGLSTRKVRKNVNDLAILAKRRKKHALIRHASDSSLCIEQSSKCKGKESNAMERNGIALRLLMRLTRNQCRPE